MEIHLGRRIKIEKQLQVKRSWNRVVPELSKYVMA